MNNQIFISNLAAKTGQISIDDDAIFSFVPQKKTTAIENSNRAISINASNVCEEKEEVNFSANKSMDEMKVFLRDFMVKISEMKLTKIATNTIFGIFKEFVKKMHTLNCEAVQLHPDDDIINVLGATKSCVLSNLHDFDSHDKCRKIIQTSDAYVKPQEVCVGTQIKMKKDKQTHLSLPTQIRPTYQYIPILDTLKKVFSIDETKKLYFEYNWSQKHQCVPGTYVDFCCGQKYKENLLFAEFPDSLQLQLFVDGFEVCDGLKSKAGKHSQIAVYLAVRNMPLDLSYNMDNIFLVALCNSAYLKPEEVDYNNLWQTIVDDCRILEDIGIYLDDGRKLKGISFSFIWHLEF